MRLAPIALFLAAIGCAVGCARGSATKRAGEAKTLVQFHITPPDAEIWVDGRFVSTARQAAAGIRMPVGTHEIEVTLAGYFPYLAVVKLVAQPTATAIDATLFPVVP